MSLFLLILFLGSQTAVVKKVHGGALTDASNLIDLSATCASTSDNSSSGTQEVPPSTATHITKGLNQSESQEENEHILIVSHGLLLRELKRVILEKFHGVLEGPMAKEALSVSPNTGVTSVTMSVNYKYNKLKCQCVECHFFNCASHLGNSKADMISQAL